MYVPSQSLFLQLNRVALGQTVNYKQASQGNPVAQNITASHGSHTTHSIRQDQEDTRRLLSILSVVVGGGSASVEVMLYIESVTEGDTDKQRGDTTRVVKNIERITAIRDSKQ